MSDPRDNLPAHINTFDRAKGFQALAFHSDRYVHAHEFNVAQEIERDRTRRIADALLKDGSLKSGGRITLSPIIANQVTATLEAAEVYIRGAMHDVAARTLVVPADRIVTIGIRLRTYTVSHPDDPTMKGLAPGTRGEGEPGASALVMAARWGWDGDGEDGDFFPIYTIDHGILVSVEQQIDNAWLDLLARYDREAHGGYVVEGFRVRALGHDDGHQVFSVSEGTINVWGYKRTRATSLRLRVPEEPEILLIDDEPHAIAGPEAQTINVRFPPISEVVEVTIIAEKTVTLTHGPYSGVADALPDPTVLSIVSVSQGATTYASPNDYVLTGAAVDWSPAGAEPAPGSTYSVTYRYLTNAVPANVGRSSFEIAGAAAGSVALVKYRMKLPRIDALVADQYGTVSYVKGISSLYAPQPVRAATTLVKLADISNDWGRTPSVRQAGPVRLPFYDLRDIEAMVADLYALVAEERLQRDVDRKEVSSKRGVFVDPLLDDDMRDQGLPQTGAIVAGALRLPITPYITLHALPAGNLAYTVETLLVQSHITGTSRINPYQVFDPPPVPLILTPPEDLWSESATIWTSDATTRVFGSGNASSTSRSTEIRVVNAVTTDIETIRVREVDFRIEMFGPHEQLVSLTFDGLDVTPHGAPELPGNPDGNLKADVNGTVTGSFMIPADVPVGVKLVEALSYTGTRAVATYTAYGWLTTTTMLNLAVTTITRWWNVDPLAQTFRLDRSRQIEGVDLKITHVGDPAKPVLVQIREVELGVPTEVVIAEATIDMRSVTVVDPLKLTRPDSDWTTARFSHLVTLEANTSYAITVLTEDGYHEVAIADLGGFDQITGWITGNAFPGGTFLDGSDGRTWLPKPGRSLTFRLRGARYAAGTNTPPARTIEIEGVMVIAATDLLPLLLAMRPEGTSIEVEFVAPNGAIYRTGPGVNVELPVAVTGDLTVRLKLRGTATLSPVILPWLQLVAGALQSPGTYISRAFPCGDDVRVRAIADVYLPSTATIEAHVQTGVDGGLPVWSAMTLERATPLGDGWVERQYVFDGLSIAETRVRVAITGGPAARPVIRGLRGVAVPMT